MDKVEILQKWIQQSKNIVVMTGAGFSKASGIPDFRSQDGLYQVEKKGPTPEEILSHHFFIEHPSTFYQYYFEHMVYSDAMPNIGHYQLAKLEKAGKNITIITQNIDGLHQKAGSQNVLELHGSVYRNYCMKCHTFYTLEETSQNEGVPKCNKCGGIIKPDVVLYEEGLDNTTLNLAYQSIVNADLLIIAGSSMVVNPAASLPYYYRGNKMAIVNLGPTPLDKYASLVIHERTEGIFQTIRVEE